MTIPRRRRYPTPDATRAEIDAWLAEHGPPPEPPHEAPPIANGPSIVCAACGVVRIGGLGSPFCKGCQAIVDGLDDERRADLDAISGKGACGAVYEGEVPRG